MVNIELLKDLAVMLIASIALIYSGLIVVKSLVKISYKLRISEFVLSFILLAFTTSLPELFIGITSAINKTPGLSLGNIMGANIMDITFVIGIVCLLGRKFKIKSKLVGSTSIYMVGIASLPIILGLIGGRLSRIDGAILMAIFFLYMARLIKLRNEYSKLLEKKAQKEVLSENHLSENAGWMRRMYLRIRDELSFNLFLFLIGMVLVFISARFVAWSAVGIASELELPRILVGMIIVSIGTTLPELVLESRAVLAKHQEMAFGDALGSVVVNSTFILGLVALIQPISIDSSVFITGAFFLIAAVSIISIMLNVKREITWKDGVFLLLFYFIFVIVQLNAKSIFIALQ